MVLKKNKAENSTLFIDAAGECVKVTNNNKLTVANIEWIVAAFAGRKEEAHFSRVVRNEEIEAADYNLTVSIYVAREDKRETVDIRKLNAEIEGIVSRADVLRRENHLATGRRRLHDRLRFPGFAAVARRALRRSAPR